MTRSQRRTSVVLACVAAVMVSCATDPPPTYPYGSPYANGPPNPYWQGYGGYPHPPPSSSRYPPADANPYAAPGDYPYVRPNPQPPPTMAEARGDAPSATLPAPDPGPPPQTSLAVPPRSNRWVEISVVRWSSSGEPTEVPHGGVLHSGDNIAFYVRAQRPGFVGLCYIDSTGAVKNLIDAAERRQLDRGQTLRIPAQADRYFPLDANVGSERAIVVASERPLGRPEFAALVDRGRSLEPTTTARARRGDEAREGSLSRGLGDASAPDNPYLQLHGGREAIAVVRIEHR